MKLYRPYVANDLYADLLTYNWKIGDIWLYFVKLGRNEGEIHFVRSLVHLDAFEKYMSKHLIKEDTYVHNGIARTVKSASLLS